eukprot:COSAG05_NODE_1466_length_4804_cov_1.788523_8_plen_198_part_00
MEQMGEARLRDFLQLGHHEWKYATHGDDGHDSQSERSLSSRQSSTVAGYIGEAPPPLPAIAETGGSNPDRGGGETGNASAQEESAGPPGLVDDHAQRETGRNSSGGSNAKDSSKAQTPTEAQQADMQESSDETTPADGGDGNVETSKQQQQEEASGGGGGGERGGGGGGGGGGGYGHDDRGGSGMDLETRLNAPLGA